MNSTIEHLEVCSRQDESDLLRLARVYGELTIASYNIRYAAGSFLILGSYLRRLGLTMPRRRPALVTKHLRRAAHAFNTQGRMPAPDIIALQEADKHTRRAGHLHIARELAHRLEMNYAHAASILPREAPVQSKRWWLDFEEAIQPDDSGDTGVATLSRASFISTERLALPWAECAWRPRTGLYTMFKIGAARLHLYNAHIDTHASIENQLAQHRFILDHLAHATRDTPADAIVILGDFNTLNRAACDAMREFLEGHGFTTPFLTGTTTWRAGVVRLHTDWIFTRNLKVKDYGARAWLGVSDHYPVWVTIDTQAFG